MGRAVELCPKPLVWVEHETVYAVDTSPEMSKLRADHRRSGPSCINMNIEPVTLGNCNNTGYVVYGADAGSADASNDTCWQQARGLVAHDGSVEHLQVHAAHRPTGGNLDEVVLANAGNPNRLVDR